MFSFLKYPSIQHSHKFMKTLVITVSSNAARSNIIERLIKVKSILEKHNGTEMEPKVLKFETKRR